MLQAICKCWKQQCCLGFTVFEIDKVLGKYAEKSYDLYKKEYKKQAKDLGFSFGANNDFTDDLEGLANSYAIKKVERDYIQGFQGLEYKLNTVGSSRGDFPFVTLTFGLTTSPLEKMASQKCLEVRKKGQGKDGFKKPVLFPKLVFLYDDELHGQGCELYDLYLDAIDCSSKSMYPDFLSVINQDTTIGKMYKEYGEPVSPMGVNATDSPCKTL